MYILISGMHVHINQWQHFFEKLEANLNKVIDHDLLLLGDFNAKNSEWFNADCTNPNGIALKDLTDHFDLTQLCRQATHLNHDGEPESLLDLVFTNVPELFSNSARVLPPISSSDHLPVVIQNKSAEYFNPQKNTNLNQMDLPSKRSR